MEEAERVTARLPKTSITLVYLPCGVDSSGGGGAMGSGFSVGVSVGVGEVVLTDPGSSAPASSVFWAGWQTIVVLSADWAVPAVVFSPVAGVPFVELPAAVGIDSLCSVCSLVGAV